MSHSIIIAVDFDGTITDHRFPEIGQEVPGAIEWMKRFAASGAKLILYTMRSDLVADATSAEGHKADRAYLTEAVEFCRARGVEFWAHNENPTQGTWTKSPKPYAHVYIDDAAFGCPLHENPRMGGRPWVDWDVVGPAVMKRLKTYGGDE